MDLCTPRLAAAGSAAPTALRFEAPRHGAARPPAAPYRVENPAISFAGSARQEKQSLRFVLVLGLVSLVMWGVLLYTLATRVQPPSLL